MSFQIFLLIKLTLLIDYPISNVSYLVFKCLLKSVEDLIVEIGKNLTFQLKDETDILTK